MNLHQDLLDLAREVATEAGSLLLAGRDDRLEVSTKTTRTDVVTQMDIAAETLIVGRILAARPDDAILGEEGGERPGRSGVRWIIDPLDGTVNFLYGLPGWAVSVAAEISDQVEVAVVVVPTHRETFWAVRHEGASVDQDGRVRRLGPVVGPADLSSALVATGFGYDERRRRAQSATLTKVLPAVRDIRRAGAAAVDLCSTAMGRVDCYYERGIQPWDRAAGALVAREAGLVVGGPLRRGQVVKWRPEPAEELTWAAPPALAQAFAELLAGAGADSDDGLTMQ